MLTLILTLTLTLNLIQISDATPTLILILTSTMIWTRHLHFSIEKFGYYGDYYWNGKSAPETTLNCQVYYVYNKL